VVLVLPMMMIMRIVAGVRNGRMGVHNAKCESDTDYPREVFKKKA